MINNLKRMEKLNNATISLVNYINSNLSNKFFASKTAVGYNVMITELKTDKTVYVTADEIIGKGINIYNLTKGKLHE